MANTSIIERLGFSRAISLETENKGLLDSEIEVLVQVKLFGIDQVYFCTDNLNSYPAIFFKKVINFESSILKEIIDIQKKIWNYKKVLFLYVYSDVEIRIYNCAEKPLTLTHKKQDYEREIKKFELASSKLTDKKKFEMLNILFSSIAVDSGIIWTIDEAAALRQKIDNQRRVDKYLVNSLIATAKQLEADGLEINHIHKLVMRSLFLLYLEDRGATDDKFYDKIKKGAKSYFDILNDVDATFLLYKKLEKSFHGNLFTVGKNEKVNENHLQIIKKCFVSGNDGTSQALLFEDWRLFDFSIIQIELLSEIYENFLSEIEPEMKVQTGTFYTPPPLVEMILNEKIPVNNKEKEYNLKVLDPACGSGIFLVESFKRLVKRYENLSKEKLTNYDTLKKILLDNIFGIEINPRSIKVAAFSLYLALMENLNPKTLWQNRKLPNLIHDPSEKTIIRKGKNLYKADSIKRNSIIDSQKFDLVVGNPPFGTDNILQSIRDYCDKYGFAKEMVLPFLHKSTLYAPNGTIALIFNTKILTNTGSTYAAFRKWLFNDCYVEKIYNFSILRKASKSFGGQLFGAATSPISVVFYRKRPPSKISERIFYYAPKTFVKSNILEGIVIDASDVKFLPRKECCNPDTKIWKIAMWGGLNDFLLLEKISNKKRYKTVEQFIDENKIKGGVGFQLLTQKEKKIYKSKYLARIKYLDADFIRRYFTPKDYLVKVVKSVKTEKAIKFYKNYYKVDFINDIKQLDSFRRLGDVESYSPPHMVVKKGLEDNSVCASYIEDECSFRDGVYGFYADKANENALKVLMAFFNSKMSTYFLFMTISSYGIEREQIMKKEFLTIPINMTYTEIEACSKYVNEIIENRKNVFLTGQIQEPFFDKRIENIIYEGLNIDERERDLIDDAINISLDLFHKKEKSKALLPVLDINPYSEHLSSELNNFLREQELFANITTYDISRYSPLILIKIAFNKKKENIYKSKESLDGELKNLDKLLWMKEATNIYFRKKLNYYDRDDIYVVRSNQRRFWSKTAAMEDASDLIIEILNRN